MHKMNNFTKQVQLRWADMDANGHMRHSVYYDLGAQLRIDVLASLGVGLDVMQELRFGPVIFKESCSFRREIHLTDTITADVQLSGGREDGSRFSFRHHLTKADGTLCAVIDLDGAWLHLDQRRLTAPPPVVVQAMQQIPKTPDFAWQPPKGV